MDHVGYALVDANGQEIQSWGGLQAGTLTGVPSEIKLPNGDIVHCAQPGAVLQDWRIVERWVDDAAPRGQTLNRHDVAYVDEKIVVTAVYDPITNDQLKAYAASKRYDVEVGGTGWNGHVVQTDRDSRGNFLAEFVAIGAGLRTDPSPWKFIDGFASVSNADMGAIILQVRNHVAQAFAVERAVVADIDSGTITTVAEIDAVNWPSNG